MTEGDFQFGMDMLVDAFRPYRWKEPDSREIYWRMLKNIDGDAWVEMCQRMVITDEDMPSVAKCTQNLKGRTVDLQGCENCDRGRVHYAWEHPTRGVTYERYCACTCEDGATVAERIVQTVKLKDLEGATRGSERPLEYYQWPEVRMRLGGALREERHGEKLHIEDMQVPEPDGTTLTNKRIKDIKAYKAAYERAKAARMASHSPVAVVHDEGPAVAAVIPESVQALEGHPF